MIIAPSNYRGKPLEWLGNQSGHALGVGCICFVYIPAMVCFYLAGEFPPKEWMVATAGALYLAFELASQGWQGADTIEDWVFVVVYGCGGAVSSFSEVTPGNPVAAFDIMIAAPFIAAMTLHLAFGAWLRWRQ